MTEPSRVDVTRAIDHVLNLAPKPSDAPMEAVAAMRRLFEAGGDVDGPRQLPRGVKVKAVDAGGVAAEGILPRDAAPDRRIVHFHGGGMIAGSLASHRAMLANFAVSAGQAVLSMDYRRARASISRRA